LTRAVNDYGVDIGGQRLVSQKPPPKEKVVRVPRQTSSVDTLVLSKKIDVTAEILRGSFDAMRREVKADLKFHTEELRKLILKLSGLGDRLDKLESQASREVAIPQPAKEKTISPFSFF
jgi:hypothetical protein